MGWVGTEGSVNVYRLVLNVANRLLLSAYWSVGWVRASVQGVRLGPGARVSPFAHVKGAYFVGAAEVGRGVTLGAGSYVNSGYVSSGQIGRWCSLAYNVVIGPTEHDPDGWTTSPARAVSRGFPPASISTDAPPPVLEDEVWIGANVVVLRGVRIGQGAIVAAGAVVTKDVPSMEIWGGVPARCLRVRAPGESPSQVAGSEPPSSIDEP